LGAWECQISLLASYLIPQETSQTLFDPADQSPYLLKLFMEWLT
jgi:hypothetical protein